MRSKTSEYRAAYWQQWCAKNRPRVQKICTDCGKQFKQMSNAQKRCAICQSLPCATCGKPTGGKDGRVKKFCSRRCVGLHPDNVARINAQRGVKPRTYYKRKRKKHGSAQEREWRQRVFARDDWTCQECGERGGRLNADHIKQYSLYPAQRFDVNNGRTLCESCHRKTPTYGWRGYWLKRRADKSPIG